MRINSTFRWIFLLVLLAVLFIAELAIGTVQIATIEVLKILTGADVENEAWREIILDFRLTRAATCTLAGAALALSGLQMQTLFRNPLAGPDVLGLSSGASLAVALVYMGSSSILGAAIQSPWVVAIAASVGCFVVFLIMMAVSTKVKDNGTLLIIGIMLAALTSSVVTVLQYLSNAEEMQVYILWTFGSLGSLNWNELFIVAILLVIGIVLSALNIKSLNAWLLGDNYAQSLGVNLQRSRLMIIISGSLLTGVVTAFCGPIAFVGLAVPHLVRVLVRGYNHRELIPAVIFGGAILLLVCDILSHLPGSTIILPVNAITALIGAPVIIWVIVRHRVIRM